MTRKVIVIATLVAALTLPGIPVLADDGTAAGTCPVDHSGAELGAHVAGMARDGHLGAGMNPGMHQGYSPMAR